MSQIPMTEEGHRALKNELARLKAERPRIAQAIETAREHGDLKENAEYHAAKEKQGITEAHIADIEDKLTRAEVIDTTKLGGDKIKFGAHVELEEIDSGKVVTYRLVGADEADISKGSISVTSPLGKSLINREVGDEVRVDAPGGVRVYEVSALRWR